MIGEGEAEKPLDDPLKPLPEILHPDSRHAHSVGLLEDQHNELALMVLHARAPRDVRQLFETAKNASLYSWFVYRFHQVAELVAFGALEMALRAKFESEQPPELARKRAAALRALFRHALERKWLRDEGYEMRSALAAQRIRDRQSIDAIEQLRNNPSLGEVALPDCEPTEAEIQAKLKEFHFVQQLAETLPDIRNWLAHGSAMLHPNSRYTLRVVCESINQLFPTAK
jgi:hypothetical protein